MLYAFEAIDLSRRNYGLHSLRAGGASAAANVQVSDRLFKNRIESKGAMPMQVIMISVDF